MKQGNIDKPDKMIKTKWVRNKKETFAERRKMKRLSIIIKKLPSIESIISKYKKGGVFDQSIRLLHPHK